MREITAQTQNAWRNTWKGGSDRPMQRATISRLNMCSYQYNLERVGYGLDGTGVFTSAIFGQQDQPVELPNIKSIRWDRSSRQDVASCTIELWNTETLPLGGTPDDSEADGDWDRPGYFTFNRGTRLEQIERWGHYSNGWAGLLMPDRVIKTYEGYGFDVALPPERDPHMYPSGVWLIDDVDYSAAGTITVTCRDIGRLLIDQIMFPPVVPFNQYPMTWQKFHEVKNPKQTISETGWSRPTYETDSNIPYIGMGFSDGGRPYVQSNGAVLGHHGRHAFDKYPNKTYWLSVGNYPNWSSAFEYIQGRFSSRTLKTIKFRPWGGPYTYFVSVYANGKWQGSKTIPYDARAVDTNADIRYVKRGRVGKDKEITVDLTSKQRPNGFANATRIRITFTDLYDSGIGTFRWRAGMRDIQISSTVKKQVDGGYHTEGNYDDYTDIIKYLCAWGGFYWPEANQITQLGSQAPEPDNWIMHEDGYKQYYEYPTQSFTFPSIGPFGGGTVQVPMSDSDNLARGRVWGHLEECGTAGKVDLGVEIWDKKPLMDGITYIKEILGFRFGIDETGGVIWRMPNIFEVGNLVVPVQGGPTGIYRTTDMYEIDERETLLGLTTKLSSRNVREKVFVANTNGKFGAIRPGYNPAPSGIRRVAGWSDQNFNSKEECIIMADLLTIRQMFTYRQNQVEIPGNPGIQVDDQIKIVERTTGETFIHYVDSISSEFDMATGRWVYSLTTHWLGESAFEYWAFDPDQLAEETKEYLRLIGKLPPLGNVND